MKAISSSGQQNFGACVSMIVLGGLSVLIRFCLRISNRQIPTWSDWLILASLLMMVLYCAMIMQYVVAGPGDGSLDFSAMLAKPEGLVQAKYMMKNLYVSEVAFVLSIGLVKLSILAFYYGLFGISRRFRRVNQIAIAVCTAWTTAFVLIYIFQCKPIHMFWTALGASEYCLASGTTTLVLELTNLFGDVLILCMPLFMIQGLQLRSTQKWTTCGIIALGGGVCVVSMIRLHYIWNPQNPQFVRVSEAMVLSTIQSGVAILCGCLPTYGPIIKFCLGRQGSTGNYNAKAYYGSKQSSRGHALIGSNDNNEGYMSSKCYSGEGEWHNLRDHVVDVGTGSRDSDGTDTLTPGTIHVKKSVEVV